MTRLVSGVVATLAGAVTALALAAWLSPDPGVTVVLSGYHYPLSTTSSRALTASLEEVVGLRARQLLHHEVHLDDGAQSYAVEARRLGYHIDEPGAAQDVLAALTTATQRRTVSQRIVARWMGKPLLVHASLQVDLDEQRAREYLETLQKSVDRAPVDAQLLIAEHEILPSLPGKRLSVEASLLRLGTGAGQGERRVQLVIEEVPPTVTEEALAPVDVTRVLSSYETSFKGKAGARAINIRTAGRYLNGAVILPGEVLSFNSYVGRRVPGRGFVDAPVIVNDELEQDVGGGVCQVATTLHAAAVFGNLEVVARRSHSRPSGYAPLGLDATVIDGKVDLELRNPYAEPLLVYVSFPSKYSIRVELLGRSPEVIVQHEYAVTHREPFARRVWNRGEMPAGTFEQKQKGSEGMEVVSVLTIKKPDGNQEKRSYRSKYYPVPEVFWLGEGVAMAELPPPPPSVSEVVVDGIERAAAERRGSASETGEEPPSVHGPHQVL